MRPSANASQRFSRRRVVIAAIAYVVLSSLLVLALDWILRAAGAPSWILPTLITLLAAGFVPTLVFASRFDRQHRPAPWIRITLTSIATVLCCAVVWFAWRGYATAVAPERSVAVMAFENLSKESGNSVVAIGISEAVLHQLASVRQLAVIARTSSFAFQGHNEDAREIGRKLNARYLLEGNVQSDRNRLRVTTQLIDATTGDHVWSMRFDKTPEDIFAVQDEIALEVARALKLSLDASTTDKLLGQRTANLDAYFAYLQGRALASTLRIADIKSAAAQFARAIKVDPKFAPAYVELASAQLQVAEFEITDDRQRRFEAALTDSTELIDKALELDPANGHAYVERAYMTAFTDLAAAEADYRRGIELSPNYAKAYEGLAAVLYENPTKRDEALDMLDRARRLDPLEPRHDVTKAVFLFYGRSNGNAATDLLRDVVERDPLYQPALTHLGALVISYHAQFAEGVKYLEQALALDPESDFTRTALVNAYLALDEVDAASSVIEEAGHPLPRLRMGLYLYRHEWRPAGEVVYAAFDNGTLAPYDMTVAACAIRMHARATGEFARARDVQERMSGVTWDADGKPAVPVQIGLAGATVGLGDMLLAGGETKRARLLLQASIADMDYVAQKLGRGDFWYVKDRAIALALLGDRDSAIEAVRHSVAAKFGMYMEGCYLEGDPAFDSLRTDERFKKLLAEVRAHLAGERELLIKMRAEGLVPDRRK